MIPILYDPYEKAFNNNGFGFLSDAVDCTVEREVNGIYELEMKYPVDGDKFAYLMERYQILAKPDPVTDPQPFRIYRITKPLRGIVTVYSRHIAYDLIGIPVSPFSAQSASEAMRGLSAYSVIECPFNFWTDKSTQGNMAVSVPASIWSLMGGTQGSILDVYGGEYDFDRYTVKLYGRLGTDRGVSIRYGKNLTALEQDENCETCYTGVYPYWTNQDGQLVQLDNKIVNAPGEYGYTRIMPLDLSQEWQDAPTQEQLLSRTQKYISDNHIGVPDVSLTISFIQLEQTEEYKGISFLERVNLGDTVSVEFPKLKVSATARAVAYKYKPIMNRYDEITLGKVQSNLAKTISETQKAVENKPDKTWFSTAMEQAGKLLLGVKGGSIRVLDTNGDGMPDTLYVADNPDPNKAIKVWRFNYEGWAASSRGYNGPFTMAATLENGILAESITAAKLKAGTISSADGGKTFFLDLNNGKLVCKNVDLSGIIMCGNSNGRWMKLESDGKISGGYGWNTYGTLNCNDSGKPFDRCMGIESDNIILQGNLWTYSESPHPTWSRGQTDTFDVVTELSIEAYGDGGVAWSYSFGTLYFENGLLTTVWR